MPPQRKVAPSRRAGNPEIRRVAATSDGAIAADDFRFGVYFQNPGTWYPLHHHAAEELYLILSGTAEWTRDGIDGQPEPPGTLIHHAPHERHATRTLGEPLLALWVWLGDIEPSVVRRRADQIVTAADRLASEFPNPTHPLGVSIGVALVLPTEDEDVDTLIARADRAMYQAKRGGKARVSIAPGGGD